MTLVMMSSPMADVSQWLFTFALISTLHWLAEIWQLSRRGATGRLEMEVKFQRPSCKLSFHFLPHCQSVPENLLAGFYCLSSYFCFHDRSVFPEFPNREHTEYWRCREKASKRLLLLIISNNDLSLLLIISSNNLLEAFTLQLIRNHLKSLM